MIHFMMNTERRVQRSEQSHIALAHYLRAEAQRRNTCALAVGTLDGLPIASWGTDDELQLAAVGSMFAQGQHEQARELVGDVDAAIIESEFGQVVFTWRGGQASSTAIEPHVARILS